MNHSKKEIPPADQPNWEDESFDYFAWFKFHHLNTLKKYHTLIESQYKKHPVGKGYGQEEITLLLTYLDEVIKLHDWLPDTGGGKDSMDKIIKYRNELEERYLNEPADDASFWVVQEVKVTLAAICNYMEAICEE